MKLVWSSLNLEQMFEGVMKTIGQQARSTFTIQIRNLNQLKQIFRRLQKIKGVENISRVKDYINYPQENA